MNDVKVIAQRYADRPKTDPDARIFNPADHIVVNPEKLQSGRMYHERLKALAANPF